MLPTMPVVDPVVVPVLSIEEVRIVEISSMTANMMYLIYAVKCTELLIN